MSLLDLIPQARALKLSAGVLGPLAGALVVVAAVGWGWHATQAAEVAVAKAERRAAEAERSAADLRARNAELAQAAERIKGSATELMATHNEEIEHAKELERAAQAATVARLRTSLGSVSGELARIAAATTAVPGGGPDQAARIASDGQTIRTLDSLFGRCSSRYVAMAERAGRAGAAGAECEQRYDSAKEVIDAAADAASAASR